MSGEIDALGGLVTAGLVADSLDGQGSKAPGRIDAAAVAARHHRCANCDAPVDGHFCANCGQAAHVHRSLIHVGEEFLHGITHFDGKTWQTLPMLLFRPGTLTRSYIEGKRARYIAPVPLFLLVVFLMFFVFSFVHIKLPGGDFGDLTPAQAAAEKLKTDKAIAELDREIKKAEARDDGAAAGTLTGSKAALEARRDSLAARAKGELGSPLDLPGAIREAASDEGLKVNLGEESLNIKARKALKNPDLAFYKIQGKAYKFSFLLVPLSLPWLWLIFAWKRGVRMYDHAIFALYSISFMSLLFIVGSIALTLDVTAGWLWGSLFAASFVHLFFQLKGTYALRKRSAAWRTVAMAFAAFMTLTLYGLLMIVLGVID
ncbi:hypothetical protein IP88_10890 [alpha proteobacterium AAP81b]|nr:hypothetical protein IP88_10890 [alpha proteobacterium AAP81b]